MHSDLWELGRGQIGLSLSASIKEFKSYFKAVVTPHSEN